MHQINPFDKLRRFCSKNGDQKIKNLTVLTQTARKFPYKTKFLLLSQRVSNICRVYPNAPPLIPNKKKTLASSMPKRYTAKTSKESHNRIKDRNYLVIFVVST